MSDTESSVNNDSTSYDTYSSSGDNGGWSRIVSANLRSCNVHGGS